MDAQRVHGLVSSIGISQIESQGNNMKMETSPSSQIGWKDSGAEMGTTAIEWIGDAMMNHWIGWRMCRIGSMVVHRRRLPSGRAPRRISDRWAWRPL